MLRTSLWPRAGLCVRAARLVRIAVEIVTAPARLPLTATATTMTPAREYEPRVFEGIRMTQGRVIDRITLARRRVIDRITLARRRVVERIALGQLDGPDKQGGGRSFVLGSPQP